MSDVRIPPGAGRRIGRPEGDRGPRNELADQPLPVDERVAAEITHATQRDNTADMGVNRNRSVDPSQVGRAGSGQLEIYRGEAKIGKMAPVKAGGGVQVPDEGPVNLKAAVGGIGSAAGKRTRPNRKNSPVKSLGGRLDDGEEAVIHGS